MNEHTGGCACGAIRYRFDTYADAGFCHCTLCRRASGAPVMAYANVPAGAFELLSGAPAEYAATDRGVRGFCAACGTGLYYRDHDGVCSINLGSLDAPAAIRPQVHIWVASQLPWMKAADLLPAFEGTAAPAPERKVWRGPADPSVTAASLVALREVTAANLIAVLTLDVSGPQRRFVALNKVSLAQALVAPEAWVRAIYAGDTAIGFTMLKRLDDDLGGIARPGEPFLWRFMIDERYQGRGLGRRALDAIVAEVATWDDPAALLTSCVTGHGGPVPFYQRAGFVDTGHADEDGERYLRLPLR